MNKFFILTKRQQKYFAIGIVLGTILLYFLESVLPADGITYHAMLGVLITLPWSIIFGLVYKFIFPVAPPAFIGFFVEYIPLYINIFIFTKLLVKET